MTGIGTTTYAYDKNGNLTADGLFTHTWNYRNRLMGSDSGSACTTYAYDHANMRVKRADGTETRIYAGRLYDTDGSTPRKHVFLPNGTLIATIEDTGEDAALSYIHTDHLGGTAAVSEDGGDRAAGLPKLSHDELKALWREYFGGRAAGLPPWLPDPRPRASPPGADLRRVEAGVPGAA